MEQMSFEFSNPKKQQQQLRLAFRSRRKPKVYKHCFFKRAICCWMENQQKPKRTYEFDHIKWVVQSQITHYNKHYTAKTTHTHTLWNGSEENTKRITSLALTKQTWTNKWTAQQINHTHKTPMNSWIGIKCDFDAINLCWKS